jgi:hypothetical protein
MILWSSKTNRLAISNHWAWKPYVVRDYPRRTLLYIFGPLIVARTIR